MYRYILLVVFLFLGVADLQAQRDTWFKTPITVRSKNPSVRQVLDWLIDDYAIPLSFNDDILPLKKRLVLQKGQQYDLKTILSQICQNENLDFISAYGQVLIKYYERPLSEYRYTLYGLIKDDETGEVLIGATVYVDSLKVGVISNGYGQYSLTLPLGSHQVKVSFVGYEPIQFSVDLKGNDYRTIKLEPKPIELGQVVVDDYNYLDLSSINILSGTNRIDMELFGDIPYLGEVDVFQGALLLPGISNIGEGLSGVNVRGGGADQNLVLLDEAVIYNPNHFLGLISVFNPDIVQDVEIVKGDLPAKYGGRNSSVMHVRQREGNDNEFHLSGGLGLLTSRLTAEGPIVKNKLNYIASARSSFWGYILPESADPSVNNLRVNFHDLNFKMKWNHNRRNKFYLSGYYGNDVNTFSNQTRQRWGNRAFSFKWNKIMAKKHFFNATTYFTEYEYQTTDEREFNAFVGESRISDLAVKLDMSSYFDPKNVLEYGGQSIVHLLNPGERQAGLSSGQNSISLPKEQGIESALYASYERQLTDKLSTYAGLRFSTFYNLGSSDQVVFNRDTQLLDTLRSSLGQTDELFVDWLPRLKFKYQLTPSSSIKVGYFETVQYMHLLSNTLTPSSSDIWDLSGVSVQPTYMKQASLGVYKFFEKMDLNISGEVFYKKLTNTAEFRDGAELLFNEFIETELLNGEERVLGLELFAKKTFGKLKGWVSYTLSRAEQRIPDNDINEGVNQGRYFPSENDRTHDLAVTGVYQFSDRLSISSNFVYNTGRPYSFPNKRYEVQGFLVPNFENRNTQRLEDYHRLDISATLKGRLKKRNGEDKNFQSSWVFSLYNVYARKNAQEYFFTYQDDDTTSPDIQKLSVLGTVLPSVTYNFKF